LFIQNLCTDWLLFFILFGLVDQIMLKLGLYDKNEDVFIAEEDEDLLNPKASR